MWKKNIFDFFSKKKPLEKKYKGIALQKNIIYSIFLILPIITSKTSLSFGI